MADQVGALMPRALFVSLSTVEFSDRVRGTANLFFDIVASIPPISAVDLIGQPFRAGSFSKVVIIAFSPKHGSELPPARTIDEIVAALPNSKYYFVFPDDQPQDPLEPFIDKVLDGRLRERAVVSLRDFVSALEVEFGDGRAVIRSGEAFGKGGEVVNDELTVSFDPSLSAEQIEKILTALANYYRACGGVGLSAEFEHQEASVLEDAHV